MACRKLDLPCLLAAGSGLLLLLPVVSLSVYPYIPAAVSLVSLAVGMHRLECRMTRMLVAILIVASWGLTIAYTQGPRLATMLQAALAAQYLATALALLRGGVGAGLPVFASSYTTMLVMFMGDPYAERVLSLGYIVLGAIIASLLSEKPHPMAALLAAPVVPLLGGDAPVLLSLVTYMAVLAGSGAVVWRGCPFKTDSGLVFAGTMLGIVGAIAGVARVSVTVSLGLYSAGLLLLLAGILTPSSPSHSAPSS